MRPPRRPATVVSRLHPRPRRPVLLRDRRVGASAATSDGAAGGQREPEHGGQGRGRLRRLHAADAGASDGGAAPSRQGEGHHRGRAGARPGRRPPAPRGCRLMARVLAAPAAPRVLLDRPAHLSWSQVTKLATGISEYGCPAQWGYAYRMGLPFVSSPAISTGTAIDAGLNAFFAARMAGKDMAEATSSADDACAAAWRKAVDAGNFDEPLAPEKDAAYLLA